MQIPRRLLILITSFFSLAIVGVTLDLISAFWQPLPAVAAFQPAQFPTYRLPSQWIAFGTTAPKDLPIAAIAWKIKGILYATPARESQVILSMNGSPDVLYRVGDELTQGLRIEKILEQSLILNHQGKRERLPLSDFS